MENNVAKMLVEALIHTLATIGKFFLAPYNCWLKAAERLVEQGKNGSVEIRNIDGFWPILLYYKRFCIDFLFDGLSLLSYPLGVLVALGSFFMNIVDYDFNYAFTGLISMLLVVYILPFGLSLYRDLCYLFLLPIRKFLDWVKKPAQYLEINKTQNK